MLPPNYLNKNSKNATGNTSPKPSIKEESKIGGSQSSTQKQRNVDRDQTVPSARTRTRKIGMANTKTNYNRKHHPSQKWKGPKQNAPKTHRSLAKRHKLTGIWVRQKSQTIEAEMERLNTKYNLDCFSDSALDS